MAELSIRQHLRVSRLRKIWALVASGMILGFSFPPFPFPWLAFMALVPLLWVWDESGSWSSALLAAFTTFLAAFAVAFSWPLAHVMPHVALASLNGVLLLPLWMSVPFGLSWLVRRVLGRTAGLVALTALYLTMEAALSYGPLAFPWELLGHTQAEALLFNGFADLTGVPGLTLWILLLNIALFLLYRTTRGNRWPFVVALAVLLGLPLAYSVWRSGAQVPTARTIHAGLVQPGSDPLAWSDLGDTSRVGNLLTLSDSLLAVWIDAPELVIWPETAVPLTGSTASTQKTSARLQAWADARKVSLLTGAVSATTGPSGRRFYRNAALLFEPSKPLQRYDKRKLVPFAEQVPFIEQWPWLEVLAVPAGGVAGYEAGKAQNLLIAKGASFGVFICLESVFGGLGRDYAAAGASFLVTITQDGWWGHTAGYRQHLAFTRLRAIETRRAVVQVSVNGTTALILPDGSLPLETNWMERTGHIVRVPLSDEPTFYIMHGDWLNTLAYLSAFLLLAATGLIHLRQKRLHEPEHAYV